MEAGFRRWLSERAENRIEFEGISDVWTLAGALRSGGESRLERREHSAESRELQELRANRLGSSGHSRSRGWRKAGLRTAAAAAVVAMFLAAAWLFRNEFRPLYQTEVGEARTIQLSDKTRVWMNSDTRLRVAFDGARRRVELIRGEAFFEVAKNASRPFVVAAGGTCVTALGTSFDIRYDASRTAVVLVEGKVAITSTSAVKRAASPDVEPLRTPGSWVLSAGQRLIVPTDAPAQIDEPPVESVLAWRRGELVLNDTPLVEAVAEMNRYDKATIVIEGSRASRLNVSGLYHTGDNEGFARSIAAMYHLDLEERGGRIYLNSR